VSLATPPATPPTAGSCVVCAGPSPAAMACSAACLRDAARERDANLRQLRTLRSRPGSETLCADLTRRNGELTGAIVQGLRPLRPHANA
jgi:hypothetical protein